MKTFTFYHKNSSAIMTITAENYTDAYDSLDTHVKSLWGWRSEDEEEEIDDAQHIHFFTCSKCNTLQSVEYPVDLKDVTTTCSECGEEKQIN